MQQNGGPIDDQMLIQLARQRIAAELGGQRSQPPYVTNNVYGSLGAGPASMPPAFGGGQPPGGGGVAPGGDPFADDPRDYMVDIVRQEYPEGSKAELADPQDPTKILQRIQMPHGGWVKRVHRWTRPKKKMVEPPPTVDRE